MVTDSRHIYIYIYIYFFLLVKKIDGFHDSFFHFCSYASKSTWNDLIVVHMIKKHHLNMFLFVFKFFDTFATPYAPMTFDVFPQYRPFWHIFWTENHPFSHKIVHFENRVLVLPGAFRTIRPSYWCHLESIYRKNIFFQNSDPLGSKNSDFQTKNDDFWVLIWSERHFPDPKNHHFWPENRCFSTQMGRNFEKKYFFRKYSPNDTSNSAG